ncbi:MAG TPA: COQ9 family protein [Rhizomicrobium sp.]|jgi:ubiquinone biosynthesis protein COQ9
MPAKKKPSDESLKAAVLAHALDHAAFDGFSGTLLAKAGKEAGLDKANLARLFPDGVLSLVEAYSDAVDAKMEDALAAHLPPKIRDRIRAAVLARLDAVRPHKEAARRAAAFLTLPPHAALGAKLLTRTVDRMWRAAGDRSTDFNFYTKRAILTGVYSATLIRWFSDDSEDEAATHAFLDARIENVMQFEKFKAQVKDRTKDWPTLSEFLSRFGREA